jgi:hypothetical protein
VRFIVSFVVLAFSAAACGGPGKAPPPRRPKPKPAAEKVTTERTDCDPRDPTKELPPLPFDERSVDEAENLANQGYAFLKRAETRGIEQRERENLITEAVNRLITALLADPYNVNATYSLAAAYARIGRAQCSVNLLSRLVPLRKHNSQRDKVEEKLDKLLGRGDHQGRLDPDFNDLRDDPRFRELVKEFDPGADR